MGAVAEHGLAWKFILDPIVEPLRKIRSIRACPVRCNAFDPAVGPPPRDALPGRSVPMSPTIIPGLLPCSIRALGSRAARRPGIEASGTPRGLLERLHPPRRGPESAVLWRTGRGGYPASIAARHRLRRALCLAADQLAIRAGSPTGPPLRETMSGPRVATASRVTAAPAVLATGSVPAAGLGICSSAPFARVIVLPRVRSDSNRRLRKNPVAAPPPRAAP